jgi:transketolase
MIWEGFGNLDYEMALYEIVKDENRYVIMTAENLAAIRNLPPLLKDRFIDTGITEQTLVGAAAGMALRGRVPVVHALAAFLTMRAFEFIRTDIGLAGLPVKLIGSIAGLLSTANGPTHQALEDVALMSLIPSMHIFCPADGDDLEIGLRSILESPYPTYVRLNQQTAVFEHDRVFNLGQAEKVLSGKDLTILTYGLLTTNAYYAALLLEQKGVSVCFLNMRSLKPLDQEAIIAAACQTKMLVTIEDHLAFGSMAGQVRQILFDNRINVPLISFNLANYFEPGNLQEVIEREGFGVSELAENIFFILNH